MMHITLESDERRARMESLCGPRPHMPAATEPEEPAPHGTDGATRHADEAETVAHPTID